MSANRVKPLDPVEPEALSMLHAVLLKLCDDRSIDIRSKDADDTAAYVIDLYQRGVRSAARLMIMAGPAAGGSMPCPAPLPVQRSRK